MQAHTVLPSQPDTARSERAFSLVEVIIAMMVLSVVLGGAAMAVVGSDSVERRTKAVADSHAMAEKGVERLRTDLSAQTTCDRRFWLSVARGVKSTGSTGAAVFRACPVTYLDMSDAKGRRYTIDLAVEPKDLQEDGFGINDTDGDLRDAYSVEATVRLQGGSEAGREQINAAPVRVAGTVDWEGGSSDDASIRVVACAIDRPDRALMAGGCQNGDASRAPITTSIQVTRLNEDTGGTQPWGSITSGAAPGMVPPGSYRFAAQQSVSSGGGTFTLLKLDPTTLRAYGSQNYVIQATYVRNSLVTRVCTQVTNNDNRYQDGYEILATNLHWRRTNQPGFRSMRVHLNGDRNERRGVQVQPSPNGSRPNANHSWNCEHVMHDPVQSSPANLYRGIYDIEVEQVNPFGRLRYFESIRPRYRLVLSAGPGGGNAASMNCRLAAWNQNMGGTPLLGRGRDAVNERPDTWGANRSSFYARMPINAVAGTQTLCLRFYSKEFERIQCQQRNNTGPYNRDPYGNRVSGCFYVTTTCRLPNGVQDNDNNCWNGADVCTSCGGGGPQGTSGPVHASRQSGGVSGGPNDPTVACSPQDTYAWPGGSRLYYTSVSQNHNSSPFLNRGWVGGTSAYYNGPWRGKTSAQGGHPYGVHADYNRYNLRDNPPYLCMTSYFTAGSRLFAGNGGPYKYYECLEVSVPGRSYKVRGRLLDVSGSGSTFFGTVGTALGLAPDAGRMVRHWNPYGNGSTGYVDKTGNGNWPTYRVARVTGDPDCGAPWVHVDPIIEEVWHKVIDEVPSRPIGPPPFTTNLGQDRLGV